MPRSATVWVLVVMAFAAALQLGGTTLNVTVSVVFALLHLNTILVMLLLIAIYVDSRRGLLPRAVGYVPVLATLGYLGWFVVYYIQDERSVAEIVAALETENGGMIARYQPEQHSLVLAVSARDTLIRYRLNDYYERAGESWLHESIKPVADCAKGPTAEQPLFPRNQRFRSFGRPMLTFCTHRRDRAPPEPLLTVSIKQGGIPGREGQADSYIVELEGTEIGRHVVIRPERMLPVPIPVIGCGILFSSSLCSVEFHSFYDEGPRERDIVALILGLEGRDDAEQAALAER